MKEKTKDRIGEVRALVGASLLLTLNLVARSWLANLSCFLVKLIKRLTQGLY